MSATDCFSNPAKVANEDPLLLFRSTFRFFRWYYVNTLTRSPVFIVGMIYGYLMHGFKGKKLQLPKVSEQITQ